MTKKRVKFYGEVMMFAGKCILQKIQQVVYYVYGVTKDLKWKER